MARNVQVKPPVRHASRQYGGGQPIMRDPKPAQHSGKNEGKFTLKQLIIFWSVTALMMLAVFVSGYRAGKEEGAREILDKSSRQMVRLPVAMPQMVKTDKSKLNKNEEVTPSNVSDPDEITKQERKIDFTKSESLPAKELPPVVEKKTTEVKKEIVNVVTPPVPKVVKKEEPYEEIYPGRRLFPPPGAAKKLEPEVVPVEAVELPSKPTPPPAPSIESLAPSPGWYVQVAAARSKEEAMELSKKLSGKGLDSKVEEASTRTGTYFRILVGPYGDRGKALGDRTTIKSTAGVSGEPFIREVK